MSITDITGVNRVTLKYDRTLGKCPFCPAAKGIRAEVNNNPFAAPNVEHATPTGTIHIILPKALAPNVIATALRVCILIYMLYVHVICKC